MKKLLPQTECAASGSMGEMGVHFNLTGRNLSYDE